GRPRAADRPARRRRARDAAAHRARRAARDLRGDPARARTLRGLDGDRLHDGAVARGAAPQAGALAAAQPAAPDRAHLPAGGGLPRTPRAAPRRASARRARRLRTAVAGDRERDGARRGRRPPASDRGVAAPHPRGDALASAAAGGESARARAMTLLSLDRATKRYARGYREVA